MFHIFHTFVCIIYIHVGVKDLHEYCLSVYPAQDIDISVINKCMFYN